MSWKISGHYFENCNCDVVCPCTASFALGADNDRCHAVLAFHIDAGEIEGVDVSGLTIAAVLDTPKYMHEGNWRLGVLMDSAASDEQAAKMGAVFGGELGGPMAAVVPLVSESMGVERVAMDFESHDGHHVLRMGDLGHLEAEDVVPFGVENGQAVTISGAFHPAGSTLTIGKGGQYTLNAFGLGLDVAGLSAFSSEFAWSN
jgi:hypothetical protein